MGTVMSAMNAGCRNDASQAEAACTKLMVSRLPQARSLWSCTKGAENALKYCVTGASTAEVFADCVAQPGLSYHFPHVSLPQTPSSAKIEKCKAECEVAANSMKKITHHGPPTREWITDYTIINQALYGTTCETVGEGKICSDAAARHPA